MWMGAKGQAPGAAHRRGLSVVVGVAGVCWLVFTLQGVASQRHPTRALLAQCGFLLAPLLYCHLHGSALPISFGVGCV